MMSPKTLWNILPIKEWMNAEAMAVVVSSLMTIITTALASLYVFNNNVLALSNFKDRAIGISIISGINASLRTDIYIGLILGAIAIFFIYLFLSEFFIKKMFTLRLPEIPPGQTETDTGIFVNNGLLYLLSFSIILSVLYAITDKAIFINGLFISLLFLLVMCMVMVVKYIAGRRSNTDIRSLLDNEYVITYFLMLPYCLICTSWVILNQTFGVTYWYFAFYLILIAALFAVYYCLVKRYCKSLADKSRLDAILISSGTPLVFIPISIPLSNELQYTLSGVWHIAPQTLSTIIIIVLVAISVAIVFLSKIYRIPTPKTFIENIFFPVILASILLFKYYQPFLTIGSYDMFHNGETMISNQQLFSYGSIPFINIYPTHGFSSLFYQILYSAVNGYRPVEPMIWSWLAIIIEIIILYFILKEIVNPLFAFLSLLLIPVVSLFGYYDYYLFGLLPALSLLWLLQKRTFGRYMVHWAIVILAMLWRIDFGMAAGAITIFFLLVFPIWDVWKNKANVKRELLPLVFSLVIVMGVATLTFAILSALGRVSFHSIMTQLVEFTLFQDSVMAYTSILPAGFPNDWLIVLKAVVEYVILPGIGVFYVIYFVYRRVVKGRAVTNPQIVLLFVAILSLIMSTRSMGRHSLIELYNPCLFVLLVICLPFYISTKKHYVAAIVFSCILLIYLVPLNILSAQPSDILISGDSFQFFGFHDWTEKGNRIIDDKSQYNAIVSFLNDSMSDNQTFLEFTNSPMLYVLSDKKFESYIIPDLYQTSEPIQNETLKKIKADYASNCIPIVIFKQNNEFWDNVDGVPNEIRSYDITEFIYENYQPVGYIGNYQIWAADNINTSLGNNVYVWQTLPIKEDSVILNNASISDGSGFIVNCSSPDPYVYNFLDLNNISNNIDGSSVTLKVVYNCSANGTAQVFESYDNSPFSEAMSSWFTVQKTNDSPSEAIVPLVSKSGKLTNIRLDPPDNSTFEVLSVELNESPYFFKPYDGMDQNFNLQMLPYIWGTYDPEKAVNNTKIIETINGSKMTLSKGQKIDLQFSPDIDKTTGNYIHIRAKADNVTNMNISYDNGTSSVSFKILPSTTYKDYLIRISTQWAWMHEPVDNITLYSDDNVSIDSIMIRKGD